MNQRPTQPDAAIPNEAAMLAFVEGDMDLGDEVAFRRALRHAPPVLAGLEAMRRDKALLRATMLREHIVPAPLVARVEESVGREALLLAASGHATIVEPALKTLVVTRGPRWGAGLAMAAALALCVGGAILVLNRPAAPAGGLARRGGSPGDVAGEPGSGTQLADAGTSPLGPVERSAPARDEVARPDQIAALPPPGAPDADGSPIVAGPDAPDATPTIALAPDAPLPTEFEEPVPGAPEPVISTRLLPGGVARRDLMALAEQHRLALRVSADEPTRVIAALEAATTNQTESGWRVLGDAPTTLAASLGVTLSPFGEESLATPDAPPSSPPESPEARPAPEADAAWLLRPTEDALAVYLAEVDMTEDALAALDRELRRAGRSRSGFAALADPLDRVLGEQILLAPAGDVIWWYHPPREWSRRTLVPVVVERR